MTRWLGFLFLRNEDLVRFSSLQKEITRLDFSDECTIHILTNPLEDNHDQVMQGSYDDNGVSNGDR